MKCTECPRPIVLQPSAVERALRYGGKPMDFIRLFTIHPECLIAKRRRETFALIKKHYSKEQPDVPTSTV